MLIRKLSVAALIAASTFATTPSFACTGISLKAGDGAAIRGRTLEFGFPMLNLPVILDGINDQGLSVGLFYFPNYAKYTDVTDENKSRAIAPQEFGVWALANFATVDEVREAVKTIVIVPTPTPGLGSPQGAVAGAHFFLQDKSGKSLVVEPVDGTLKVHDASLGVMTNAPTYDWHMTNLSNYVNLSVHDIDQTKVGGVTVPAFGAGTGLLGLPGDFTPPSRFVRAVVYSKAVVPNQTAEDAVFAAFHILNQFDIPKGSVMNSAVGEPTAEITEWTSVADLKNLRWYFRTREDQSIRVVDLKQALDAAKGEIATIEMEASRQPYTNVSGEAKKLDTAAN